MVTHAGQGGTEIVVDGRGNIYINGADFNFSGGEASKPGYIKLKIGYQNRPDTARGSASIA